ncbi:TPA: hypothetical protein ACVU5P_004206 [Vibrio parahaemolyticus]
MIADEYRQAKQPEKVDLNSIKLTAMARELLSDLMESSDRRLFYTPQQEWGHKAHDEFTYGAKLIALTKLGTFENIRKTNRSHINCLFDAGLIKVDNDIRPHPRIVIFKLATPQTHTAMRELRAKVILKHIDKVTKVRLQELARVYGLDIEYSNVRRLFSIAPLNADEKHPRSYIFESAKGEPVTGYNDLTMVEWDELFYQKAKALGLG